MKLEEIFTIKLNHHLKIIQSKLLTENNVKLFFREKGKIAIFYTLQNFSRIINNQTNYVLCCIQKEL
jgi:hypothetical protein